RTSYRAWLSRYGAVALLLTTAGSSLGAQPDSLRLAESETEQPGRQARQAEKLDEVVVTARRREEKAQTVPIAVTVVSQQQLQDNNVQTLADLQYLVPSMTAGAVLSRDTPNVFIRGQGTSSLSSQPGVVAYVNEVPLPTGDLGTLAGGPGSFFDLQNIQV